MPIIKRKIRDWIRDSPLAYPIFLRFYLRKRLKLPDSNTDCHLTGYPRSANTYSHYLAKGLFPELRFVTHVHTVASLKAAKRNSVPVGVILRSPVDCVVSMCMKYKKEPSDRAAISGYLYDYIHYHAWLDRYLLVVAFFTFEDVTGNSDIFIQQLAAFLNMPLDSTNLSDRIYEIEQAFAAREAMKDPDGSSLPKEGRKKRKAVYVEAVHQAKQLPDAVSIYERLLTQVAPRSRVC